MSAANGRNLDALVGHSPVYSDSLVSLYQGDALALLELFPSGLVDVVVMDPPYGVGTGEVGDWTKGGWAGAFSNALLHVCGPLYRATKPDAAMYVFTSWARMADWIVKWREYFKMQGFIVWDKGRHSGTFGPYSWQFHWEGIYYGLKGPRKIRKYMPDIVRMKNKPDHAMQKPTELCRMLIEASTDEGDLVLDPFCGTGATLLAARECGRRAIGFEILPERCEIAASRLRNGGLFDMPNVSVLGTRHLWRVPSNALFCSHFHKAWRGGWRSYIGVADRAGEGVPSGFPYRGKKFSIAWSGSGRIHSVENGL